KSLVAPLRESFLVPLRKSRPKTARLSLGRPVSSTGSFIQNRSDQYETATSRPSDLQTRSRIDPLVWSARRSLAVAESHMLSGPFAAAVASCFPSGENATGLP